MASFSQLRRSLGGGPFGTPPLRGRDGARGPAGPRGGAGPSGITGANVKDYGAVGDGATDDVDAILAAEAAGLSEIFFPPGVYKINSALALSVADRTYQLAPGATLLIMPGRSAVFGGARTRIAGLLSVRISTTSSSTWDAVQVSGAGSQVGDSLFTINANVANCTLLNLAGDNVTAGEMTITGVGSFKRGLDLAKADDTNVKYVRTGRLRALLTDDGVNTRTYDSLIRFKSQFCKVGGLAVAHGGRQTIAAIIDVVTGHNDIDDVQINSSGGAAIGVLLRDNGEFFGINGGEIVGNFLAGSTAVQCGDGSVASPAVPAVGQLKCSNVKWRGWDYGIKITGSADAITLIGCTWGNNKIADIEIDSKRGSDEWPVSALAVIGGYREANTFTGCTFLHLNTGALEGGVIQGIEIGYAETAVLVESTMGTNVLTFGGGCRFAASAGGDAVTTPNTNSRFHFAARDAFFNSNLISKGTFASKATSIFVSPEMTSLTVGSSGTPITKYFSVVASLNFSTNLDIGQHQDVVATVAGIAIGDQLAVSIPDAIWYPGDVYTWRISGAGQVTVTRISNFHVAAGAGDVRISYWKH